MVWKSPTSRRLPADGSWLELARWCLTPEGGKNAGSRMHRAAAREIRHRMPAVTTLVSYSDPSVGHTGALYKACNYVDLRPRSRRPHTGGARDAHGEDRMNLGRYETMLAEHGMRPFERIPWVNPETGRRDSRVLGKRPPMRWRVSVDEWERLEAMTREAHGWTAETYLGASFLFGWPIAPDDTLPPRSIVFEPELASRRDSPDTETASHG